MAVGLKVGFEDGGGEISMAEICGGTCGGVGIIVRGVGRGRL